ncbi:transglutaminase family protein [Geomesophilobacter sediminis]|uniref:DUF3488 domain-containing protein n=1 Tax=Geomesophilobacter sediminis TaxID=2798584 RepID=A0A8J7M184_9BACT|nr:transglutaminaseTgpA domain-containing protein [Geomesophilobacter sediminis]MBJ6726762.1 DUF3488 domain-containing protein [Geomesophilobacter sediminis]
MVKIKAVVATLAIVIASIGYLPLFPYLDPLARWFFPVALVVGVTLERREKSPGGKILTPLSILLFLYYVSGLSLETVVAVTSNLLVVLLAVRMLGEKSGRNYLQIFGLSLFCLAASSLYNLSALFLVYLLALLLLLAVSLVVLTFQVQEREIMLSRLQLKRVLSVALLMPVASLPLMLFLFFLLPRTPYPLWSFLKGGGARQVGFTDTVRPGATSSVTTPKNVAFRAVCRKLPEDSLYWRGIVLNGYAGDAWVRLAPPEGEDAAVPAGESVEQEIYPEPSATGYLIALNLPRKLVGVRNNASPDQVFTGQVPGNKRVSYRAWSVLSDSLKNVGDLDRSFYLALPRSIPPRLFAEGQVLAARSDDAEGKIAAVRSFFRSRRLSYTTHDLPVGKDALDSFLYVKRHGNCEYFASACALLLRLGGVPARLVGGYHGGIYSDMGGYYLITEDTAHVWVEAFVDGKGWVKIDPSQWSQGFVQNESLGARVRLYADLMGFYWNKAVVTYDLEKQISLVRTAAQKVRGFSAPSVPKREVILVLLAAGGIVAVFFWIRQRPASPEERLVREFLRIAARRDPELNSRKCGVYEASRRLRDPALKEFAAIYGAAVYQDRPLQTDELRRCRDLLKQARQQA